MIQKAILVFSLMLLAASLSAAQNDDATRCGDGTTYCSADEFCDTPGGSGHSVCVPLNTNYDVLCAVCGDRKATACVTGANGGQVSCSQSPLANCDNGCSDKSQVCIAGIYSTSACFPKATGTGPVSCGDGTNYCGAGTFCTFNDDSDSDQVVFVCAPLKSSDELCAACPDSDRTCYQSTKGGPAACLSYVNCADKCSDVKYFCAKKNSGDATGACLEYSTTIGTVPSN